MPDLPVLRGSVCTEGLSSGTGRCGRASTSAGRQGYGSTTSKVEPGANSDLISTFHRPTGVNYNWLTLPEAHSNTTGFGAFAGYNSQWEDVVLSLEGNYIHDGIRSVSDRVGAYYNGDLSYHSLTHSNAIVKLSDFGSLRVRAGYAMGCFLPYVFAGMGFGSETVERNVSATPAPMGTPLSSNTKTNLVYGYSGGAGIDVMLTAGFFLRAEYEYQRVTSSIETNINSGRLGIGYKF